MSSHFNNATTGTIRPASSQTTPHTPQNGIITKPTSHDLDMKAVEIAFLECQIKEVSPMRYCEAVYMIFDHVEEYAAMLDAAGIKYFNHVNFRHSWAQKHAQERVQQLLQDQATRLQHHRRTTTACAPEAPAVIAKPKATHGEWNKANIVFFSALRDNGMKGISDRARRELLTCFLGREITSNHDATAEELRRAAAAVNRGDLHTPRYERPVSREPQFREPRSHVAMISDEQFQAEFSDLLEI